MMESVHIVMGVVGLLTMPGWLWAIRIMARESRQEEEGC